MILHLVEDEKVVNRLIKNFEEIYPGQNIFVCMCRKNTRGEYIPTHINTKLGVLYYDYRFEKFKMDISSCSLVIIHYLTYQKALFVNKYVNNKARICWSVWGGDLFGLLHDKCGYRLYSTENSHHETCSLRKLIKSIFGVEKHREKTILKFIDNRLEEIIGTEEDRLLLNKYLGLKNLKLYRFYYYTLEQIINEAIQDKYVNSSSTQILIGNSASYTGNHEYVLKYLSELDLAGWSICMPLSYGGDPEYNSIVEQKAHSLWGDSFRPLKQFLPLDEYNSIVLNSKASVYGHWREEAFGNIVLSLYTGSKVFLSRNNPYYEGLRGLGFIVYELETISKDEIDIPMTVDEKEHNKLLCNELFSLKETKKQIECVVNGIYN